jgi:hypothetical protein
MTLKLEIENRVIFCEFDKDYEITIVYGADWNKLQVSESEKEELWLEYNDQYDLIQEMHDYKWELANYHRNEY